MAENKGSQLNVTLNPVLPLSKIKGILKAHPEVQNITGDAAKLVRLTSEQFLRCFVKECVRETKQAGRKTVLPKDLDLVVDNVNSFDLLEDALDDWPEPEARHHSGKPGRKPKNQNIFGGQEEDKENDTTEVEADESAVAEVAVVPAESAEMDIEDIA
ncbi:unnamed protein product [Bursaphelenchus xylophilus]|uniref:(pine wood nematode) hypothetical protein n=1 Tax=Bursaphelenchus xylophilus TaxID=6326 RepID=A0A1I7S1L7_BURXY|nr:unnamed protein product [Bursaphelenchus xylophilus]CAG9081291.1 unnamed protein product [Bursaphelenchus xylophilus]